MLVYIENKNILAQILTLLDISKIEYTTNVKNRYNKILITDINNKILKIIKNKKAILLTNYIEDKILNKDLNIENLKIITSMPILKNNKNTTFIPKPIPRYNVKKNKEIYTNYNISKNKKKIIIIDKYLKYIKELENIMESNPDYEIIYVGYKNIKKQEKLNNVIWIKYINLDIFNDLCNISNIVIIFDKDIDINYIYMAILTHTEIFMIEDNMYNNYFVSSKHYYSFNDTKNLNEKLKKLLTSRTSSLNYNSYLLIQDNTEKKYIEEIKKILK